MAMLSLVKALVLMAAHVVNATKQRSHYLGLNPGPLMLEPLSQGLARTWRVPVKSTARSLQNVEA